MILIYICASPCWGVMYTYKEVALERRGVIVFCKCEESERLCLGLAVIQLGFIFLGVGAPCGKCVVDLCRFTPSENLFVHGKIGLLGGNVLLISGGRWMSCARTVLMHGDGPDDGPQRRGKGLPRRSTAANRRNTMIAYLFRRYDAAPTTAAVTVPLFLIFQALDISRIRYFREVYCTAKYR